MARPLLKFIRYLKRLLKVKEEIDPRQARKGSRVVIKYLMGLAAVFLITLLYPAANLQGPLDVPRQGEIAPENIIADLSFLIPKSEDALAEERQLAITAAPVYLDYNIERYQDLMAELNHLFDRTDSLRKIYGLDKTDSAVLALSEKYPYLSQTRLQQLYRSQSQGLLNSVLDTILAEDIYYYGIINDLSQMPPTSFKSLILRKQRRDLIMIRSQLIDQTRAFNILLERLNLIDTERKINIELAYEIGRHFIHPNVFYNEDATLAARDSALATISLIVKQVGRGDLLVRRGAVVDEAKARLLQAYALEIQKQNARLGWFPAALPLLGRLILITVLVLLLYLFMYYFRPDVYWSNNKLLAILLIIGLELFLVNVVVGNFVSSVYLYPIALVSILVTILFDARLGVVLTLLVALLLGVLNRFNFTLTLISALAGMVACYSAGEIRRRSDFYRIILFVSLTYIVGTAVIESLKLTPTGDIMTNIGYGLINGFVTPMLTISILPFFESIFGFSTNITLLELADLNHPILKRLSMSAPGTYHHSIVVGNLAEAAAKAIGANPLLARVGAYYHDIGKMEIPEYFVENQLGIKSKHETLNPSMSALVLSSHVKKGRRLGEEAGLPDTVLNFVEEHHGTTQMTYFFNKAKEMDLPIDSDAEFRYPGPKPQSKETAIVMLADSTEAASRTLENPSAARIRNLIQRLINDKFSSGELTECDLTLKDLNDIREAFVKILIGVFHQRIAYPKKEEEEAPI